MTLEDMLVSVEDTETHRVCGTCGCTKPLSEFYKDGKHKNGKPRYRRDCKDCYKVTRLQEAEMKRTKRRNKR